MNVIANITGEAYTNCGLERALSRLKIDKLIIIELVHQSGQPLNRKQTNYVKNLELREKCIEVIHFRDAYQAIYPKFPAQEDLIPLDSQVLDSLSPYLTMAIKMCERMYQYDLTFEERMDKIFQHLKYWNTVIERHSIDLFVNENVPHELYDYLIYALCKVKNIPTIFSYNCPAMGYSYTLSSIESHCPEVALVYDRLAKEYMDTPIDDIALCKAFDDEFKKQLGKDEGKTPYYMIDGSIKDQYELLAKDSGRIKGLFSDFKYLMDIITHPSERYVKFLAYTNYKNTKNYYLNWSNLSKPIDMQKEKYIYFPLHFQPEVTTTPLGSYYTWQYLTIELLSSCLPKDVYIYVKENPKQGMQGRTLDFPSTLANIPQVKLVHRDTDTYQLMHNSLAVATVTGTALWEGLFKGKPVIAFGDYIVQHAPGAFRVRTLADCEKAVTDILSRDCCPTIKELKLFSKAMEETCDFGFIDRSPLLDIYDFDTCVDGIYNLFLNGFKKHLQPEHFMEEQLCKS